MRPHKFMFSLLIAFAVTVVCASQASAQATRTWVSGVGDDANPCSRTAPCKTFAGAISKTAAGGEISVLDPGGFGAVTITKAITINGDGTLAGIVSALVNGIIVNAGANDIITIRSVSIQGVGSGLNGIRFLAGRHLHVENCSIAGVTTHGIDMSHSGVGAGELTVKNTSFTNIGSVAVRVAATAGSPSAQLHNVNIQRASIGFDVLQGKGTISNSVISHATNTAVAAENVAVVNLVSTSLTKNGFGVQAFTSGSTINLANSDIFDNTTGVNVAAGGVCNRFQNNRVFGNTTNFAGVACTPQTNQ